MAQFSNLYDDALHQELGSNDTSQLFTTVRRKHAINQGVREFVDLTECLTRRSTISCTQGTQEFNLNSSLVITNEDFLRVASEGPIFQVSDSNGPQQTFAGDDFLQKDIPFLDAAQPGWRSTVTGYPSGWYLRSSGGAHLFGLDRPLYLSTGSTETAQIVLPYVMRPSSMTADTAVPFTVGTQIRRDLDPYQMAPVHFAASELEKLRKDWDASDRQLQKFQGYVMRYLNATRPKGSRTVRTARPYFSLARQSRYAHGGVLTPYWYR